MSFQSCLVRSCVHANQVSSLSCSGLIFLNCFVLRVGSLFLTVNFRLVLPAQPPAATPSPACSRRQRQPAGFGEHGFCVAHLFFFLCSSLLQDVLGISAATLPTALFSYHVPYISSSRDVLYFLFLHSSQFSVHLLVNFKSLAWKLMGFLKNLS